MFLIERFDFGPSWTWDNGHRNLGTSRRRGFITLLVCDIGFKFMRTKMIWIIDLNNSRLGVCKRWSVDVYFILNLADGYIGFFLTFVVRMGLCFCWKTTRFLFTDVCCKCVMNIKSWKRIFCFLRCIPNVMISCIIMVFHMETIWYKYWLFGAEMAWGFPRNKNISFEIIIFGESYTLSSVKSLSFGCGPSGLFLVFLCFDNQPLVAVCFLYFIGSWWSRDCINKTWFFYFVLGFRGFPYGIEWCSPEIGIVISTLS